MITPDTEAALSARAGSALARMVALEELHDGLRRLLLRRARRGAPRGRDWQRVERLVAAVGGGQSEGVWRPQEAAKEHGS